MTSRETPVTDWEVTMPDSDTTFPDWEGTVADPAIVLSRPAQAGDGVAHVADGLGIVVSLQANVLALPPNALTEWLKPWTESEATRQSLVSPQQRSCLSSRVSCGKTRVAVGAPAIYWLMLDRGRKVQAGHIFECCPELWTNARY